MIGTERATKDVPHDLIKLLVSLLRRRLGQTRLHTCNQSKTTDLRPRRMLRGALVRAVIIAKGGARTFPTSSTASCATTTRAMGSKLSAAFGSPDVRATKRRGNAAVDAAATAGTSSGATKRRNATTAAATAGENADGKPSSSSSKQRRAKPIKLELEADKPAVGGVAPDGWETTLAKIKKFRAEGPEAAVDTMGCEKIAELGANETSAKHRRYLTLTSAMLSSQTKDEINHAAMKRLCAHGCTPETQGAVFASDGEDFIGRVRRRHSAERGDPVRASGRRTEDGVPSDECWVGKANRDLRRRARPPNFRTVGMDAGTRHRQEWLSAEKDPGRHARVSRELASKGGMDRNQPSPRRFRPAHVHAASTEMRLVSVSRRRFVSKRLQGIDAGAEIPQREEEDQGGENGRLKSKGRNG
jgi:hypothetical protein